ncbi:MAG: chemotaxis protein CheX [Spirochaetae bacterium HGW-Spirochaetae-6]|nr:MAG: chemotaxis protein CheX [Spirochaetae bacterium HGW-Spirochaetae-6]
MRIDFITPFLEATEEILKELLDVEVQRGEMDLKPQERIPDVGVLVGVTGQAVGRMLIISDRNLADKLVEIMNGEKHDLRSDMAQSTIGEIGNMIMGRAITKLYDLGFHFEITPPSVIVGSEVRITTLGIETLSVPYTLPMGSLEINISLKENA